MYREDVVESAYAMALIHGLNAKTYVVGGVPGKLAPGRFSAPMYEGLCTDPMPGRKLTQAKLDKRRAKAKRAKQTRKSQR